MGRPCVPDRTILNVVLASALLFFTFVGGSEIVQVLRLLLVNKL